VCALKPAARIDRGFECAPLPPIEGRVESFRAGLRSFFFSLLPPRHAQPGNFTNVYQRLPVSEFCVPADLAEQGFCGGSLAVGGSSGYTARAADNQAAVAPMHTTPCSRVGRTRGGPSPPAL